MLKLLVVAGVLAGVVIGYRWALDHRPQWRPVLLAPIVWTWEIPAPDTAGMSPPVVEVLRRSRARLAGNRTSQAAWYDYGITLQAHALLEEAETVLRRAWTLRPDDPRPPHLLGIMAPALGHPVERTIDYFRAAARLDPRYPPVWIRLGNTYADHGRFDEAVAALRTAIALDPAYPIAHRQLGLALLESGDLPGSMLHLEFAAELVPEDYLVWNALARAYRQAGLDDRADEAASRTEGRIEVMSYRDSIHQDMWYRNRGPLRQLEVANFYIRNGYADAAIAALKLAEEGMPQSVEIQRGLARLYAHKGMDELARRHRARADALVGGADEADEAGT